MRHDGTGWHFHHADEEGAVGPLLAGALGIGLLVIVRDGGGRRLGTCDWEGCDHVYVDVSRNGSRRYCDPRTCGNRAAVRAYRARAAAEG